MDAPFIAHNSKEAVVHLIGWLGAAIGFLSFIALIHGFLRFYVGAGDAEKNQRAIKIMLWSAGLFIVSFLISFIAYLNIYY